MAQKVVIYQCEDNWMCCLSIPSRAAPFFVNGIVRRNFEIIQPKSIVAKLITIDVALHSQELFFLV
jgi:hypothetical protein